ncbi:MAG: hypothetical protein ACOCZ5_01845 [bacterium]
MNKFLYNFHWYCGRQGDVEGLFVATEEEIKNLIGKEVWFGEILGKHSEIYGVIEEGEIEKLDISSVAVEEVSKHLGRNWSGYNPLDYINYECNECGCVYDEEEFNVEKNMCDYCVDEMEEYQ